MERTVAVQIKIEQTITPLQTLPISIQELVAQLVKLHPRINWAVYYNDNQIKSTRDLVITYLNNKTPELLLQFKPAPNPMTVMDDEVKQQFEQMARKFQQFNLQPSQATQALPTQNGILSKQDLLRVLQKLTSEATRKLFQSGFFFINKRQEFYGVDEQKYKQTVLEQLQFQDMLIMSTSAQTMNIFGLSNMVFDQSVQAHQTDPQIAQALEKMSIQHLQGIGEVPEELTREKLKEILLSSCEYLKEYIRTHDNQNPMEIMILKSRESDEVMKRFGYNEYDITAAMNKFQMETEPYFEDVRQKLNDVTKDLFGFNPAEIPRQLMDFKRNSVLD